MNRFLLILFCLALSATAFAEVKLPAIISDNMVIQEGARARVWGWADAGETVEVAIAGQTQKATADEKGQWQVMLDPIKSVDALTMTVTGKNALAVKNILVGEVWLASGQSNMRMEMAKVNNAQEEIKNADHPQIRLFSLPLRASDAPEKDCVAQWALCSPETVRRFSSTAYFFGRDISMELGNKPIGLIHSSCGATGAEAWTPVETLRAYPELADTFVRWDAKLKAWQERSEKMAEWTKQEKAAKEAGQPFTTPKPPETGKRPPVYNFPGVLYNGMIAPVEKYTIRGAIWYQGETNGHDNRGREYRTLFPAMIKIWREKWAQGDFPFLYVQIANYGKVPPTGNWMEVREAQTMTLALPNTGMAVAIDIGDAGDIHPKNKQEVGRRLALIAMAKVYGKTVAYSGPMYKAHEIKDGKVVISFDHADGLTAKDGKLPGFEIAGEDRKFVPADAKIVDGKVELSSAETAKPLAIRYGWASNPTVALYNAAGLPASPFRTDDW